MRRNILIVIVMVIITATLNSSPNNRFNLSLDMLGYPLLSGPTLTFELPFDNVRYHLNTRLGIGAANIVREAYTDYYSIGLGANYFFNGAGNGFYTGATLEYARASYMYKDYFVEPILWMERHRDMNSVSMLANIGYNWEYQNNLYLRLGGSLGAKFANKQDTFFVMNPQLMLGYSF